MGADTNEGDHQEVCGGELCLVWPKLWPEDCPPKDALPANGVLYRGVASNPPTPDDFRSQDELGAFKNAPQCLRLGVSLLTTLDDALHYLELFPRAKFIARSKFQPVCGRIKPKATREFPSHHTWWSPEGFPRESVFSCLDGTLGDGD